MKTIDKSYKNALSRLEVKSGDVWQITSNIANMIIYCGDVTKISYYFLMKKVFQLHENFQIDVLYSDPPWSQGNSRMFHTKAGVSCSNESFDNLVYWIGNFINKHIKYEAWIETSYKNYQARALEYARPFAGRLNKEKNQYFGVVYGSPPRPEMLCRFPMYEDAKYIDPANIEGKTGIDEVKTIASNCKYGKSVFDPCCGECMTGEAFYMNGFSDFYGCELIPSKASSGIQRMAKLLNSKPKLMLRAENG